MNDSEFIKAFKLYIRAMQPGETQTAFLMLANHMADRSMAESTCDLSPAAAALIERACPDCET